MDRTRHEGGLVRGEVERGLRDLVRRCDAPEGMKSSYVVHRFGAVGDRSPHRRVRAPGGEHIDPDPLSTALCRQCKRQSDEPRLCRGIARHLGHADRVPYEGRGEDQRAAIFAKASPLMLRAEERTREVYGHSRLPVAESYLFCRHHRPQRPSVVHRNVEPAKPSPRRFYRALGASFIPNVARIGNRLASLGFDLTDELVQLVLASCDYDHARTLAREESCRRTTDARARARDECHLVLQSIHSSVLSLPRPRAGRARLGMS